MSGRAEVDMMRGAKVCGLVAALVLVGCAKTPRDPVVELPPPPRVAEPLRVAPAPKAPEASPRPKAESGETGGNVGDRAPLIGPVLETARDHVAIVYVWASWCMPCKRSLPELQRLYVKYKGRGLVVVGISVDDERKDALEFAKSLSLGFALEWDEKHALADEWHVKTMPSAYVLDAAGIVRFVQNGYHEGEVADLEAELRKYL